MYSGKIAVPPGGGGIVIFRLLNVYLHKLSIHSILNNKKSLDA
jgi:hypothetical protein